MASSAPTESAAKQIEVYKINDKVKILSDDRKDEIGAVHSYIGRGIINELVGYEVKFSDEKIGCYFRKEIEKVIDTSPAEIEATALPLNLPEGK